MAMRTREREKKRCDVKWIGLDHLHTIEWNEWTRWVLLTYSDHVFALLFDRIRILGHNDREELVMRCRLCVWNRFRQIHKHASLLRLADWPRPLVTHHQFNRKVAFCTRRMRPCVLQWTHNTLLALGRYHSVHITKQYCFAQRHIILWNNKSDYNTQRYDMGSCSYAFSSKLEIHVVLLCEYDFVLFALLLFFFRFSTVESGDGASVFDAICSAPTNDRYLYWVLCHVVRRSRPYIGRAAGVTTLYSYKSNVGIRRHLHLPENL